jgi:hypothetical protein
MAIRNRLRMLCAVVVYACLLDAADLGGPGVFSDVHACLAGTIEPARNARVPPSPHAWPGEQYTLTFEEWFAEEKHQSKEDWQLTLTSRVAVVTRLGSRFAAKVSDHYSVAGKLTREESGGLALFLDDRIEITHGHDGIVCVGFSIIPLVPGKRVDLGTHSQEEPTSGVAHRAAGISFSVVVTESSARARAGAAPAKRDCREPATTP